MYLRGVPPTGKYHAGKLDPKFSVVLLRHTHDLSEYG